MPAEPPLLEKPSVAVQMVPIKKLHHLKIAILNLVRIGERSWKQNKDDKYLDERYYYISPSVTSKVTQQEVRTLWMLFPSVS